MNELGVTKAASNIELKRFETSIRRYLELTVPRLMLVLEPLAVTIDDLDDDHLEMLNVPFSKDLAYGVSLCFLPYSSLRGTSVPAEDGLIVLGYSRIVFPSRKRYTLSAVTSVRWTRTTISALRLGNQWAF